MCSSSLRASRTRTGAAHPGGSRRALCEALTIRTPSNRVDQLHPHEGDFEVTRHAVRTHSAARFGRATADDKTVVRETQVQTAFKFRYGRSGPSPDVDARGAEGLDLHTFSHAVVHWNPPPTPSTWSNGRGASTGTRGMRCGRSSLSGTPTRRSMLRWMPMVPHAPRRGGDPGSRRERHRAVLGTPGRRRPRATFPRCR